MAKTLSLCMIVRDEEANLDACLASVAGAVDEIVVSDTGSVDRTKEIARAHGAIVVERAWTRDFAAARNHAIEHATKDWVLILDADETIDTAARPLLRAAIATTSAAALKTRTRNLLPPGEIAAFNEIVQTRLFRRDPAHRYVGKVHEQITGSILDAGGTIAEADAELIVLHHGYRSETAQGKDRGARNLALLITQNEETPGDPFILYNLGATFKNMRKHDEARRYLVEALEADRGALTSGVRERLYTTLAQLALGAHDDALAAEYALATLAIGPANPLALQILALGLVSKGDVAGAVDAFRRLRRSPALAPNLAADIDKVLAALAAGGK